MTDAVRQFFARGLHPFRQRQRLVSRVHRQARYSAQQAILKQKWRLTAACQGRVAFPRTGACVRLELLAIAAADPVQRSDPFDLLRERRFHRFRGDRANAGCSTRYPFVSEPTSSCLPVPDLDVAPSAIDPL